LIHRPKDKEEEEEQLKAEAFKQIPQIHKNITLYDLLFALSFNIL